MFEFPKPTVLAALVSNVTETMCGVSFKPVATGGGQEDLCWRTAVLPIKGAQPLRVALSSNKNGATALGAALLGIHPESLDDEMINDALCELLNMAAGQIKNALNLDQALGLPRILDLSATPSGCEQVRREGVLLRSVGDIDLVVWLSSDLQ